MKLPSFSRPLLGVVLSSFLLSLRAADTPAAPAFGGAHPLEWSQRLARSELERSGARLVYGGTPRARWDYTSGLFALSLVKLADATGDASFREAGEPIVTSFIAPDGSIRTYKLEDYNIDMMPPGKVALLVYERTKEERIRKAIDLLRKQLAQHPRTSEGGFWHKQRYPYQMWLDGLYMGAPFLAHYGKVFNEPAAFDDVAKQLLLMDQHGYDPKTGLFYHAWDEKRQQPWANQTTGQSPNFWGRAVGWYAMALVDCLDFLPPTHPDVEAINDILHRLADGVVRWQDPQSGVWWQVMDQGGREGNYLEATASSMFVYSLAKGINRGYLSRDKYLPAVRKGYEGIIREFIRTGADGRTHLTRCCEVAGLGYTSSSGRPRDGTFDYYVSEPIIDNDLKGVGPFILAGIELQQLFATSGAPTPFLARGWSDYETVLARIQAPTFPARDFPITDFGAKAGGADCTEAIAKAIAACNQAGGGRVVIPAGEWHTGAIHLKSNVNLHVSEGATLKFSTDPKKYPIVFTRWEGVECMNYSPLIYAFEQENIAITGRGTLDGQADWDNWWGWNQKSAGPTKQRPARDRLIQMGETDVPVEQRIFGEGSFLRPNFVQPYRCKNILIADVTIVRSPMWELHPVLSRNITVRAVKITSHGPNNDGCDPESSADILIEDCLFDTGDDCIAIKSGRNNDGRRLNVPSENIVVRNCTMKDGHGGVVIGSEISGGTRNVFIDNCVMDSPNLDRALRFKSNAQRGGVLENVFMRNVKVGRVAEAVLTIDLLYEEGTKGPHRPIVRNVSLDNVTSTASPRVMWIAGFDGATINNVRFTNCTFRGVEAAELVTNIGSFSFQNVTIEPAKRSRSLNSPTAATAGGTAP
ncbi:MAG TPA: glycoside hydrolase family 88 protein [Opitutaceae bacterium]